MMNDVFNFDDFFGRPFPLQSRRTTPPTSRTSTSQRARPPTTTFSQRSPLESQSPFQHPFFQHPFFSPMFEDFEPRQRQPSQPQPQPQSQPQPQPHYQFQPEDQEDDPDVEYLGSSYLLPSASSAANGRTREPRPFLRRPQPRVEEPQESEEMTEEQPPQPRAQSSSSPLPPKPHRQSQSQSQSQSQPRFPSPSKPSSQNQRASGPSVQILDELDEKHIPENEPQPVAVRANTGACAGVSNVKVSMNSKSKAPPLPEPTFQLRQDADKYVATYHLPGFPPNQVKLEAQIPGEDDGDAGTLLCISAERKTGDSDVVPFSSILEIPNGVPPSAISAHYDDAKEVLTVFVPKPKASVAAIDIQRS